jgi:hypothetical protein
LIILLAESSGSKQKEWAKGTRIWHFEVSLFIVANDFLHAVKSYDMGTTALLPLQRKVSCGFLSPLKIHRLSRVLTQEPWVQWQAHQPLQHHSDYSNNFIYLYEIKTAYYKMAAKTVLHLCFKWFL